MMKFLAASALIVGLAFSAQAQTTGQDEVQVKRAPAAATEKPMTERSGTVGMSRSESRREGMTVREPSANVSAPPVTSGGIDATEAAPAGR